MSWFVIQVQPEAFPQISSILKVLIKFYQILFKFNT
jgi:hypothetical protein